MSPIGQLTARQQAVFEFVREKIQNRGYGPTVREIGEQFGISSPNGVMCHLKALEKKGYIARDENLSRSIRLPGRPSIEIIREIRNLLPKNPGDKSRNVKLSADLVAELVRLAD